MGGLSWWTITAHGCGFFLQSAPDVISMEDRFSGESKYLLPIHLSRKGSWPPLLELKSRCKKASSAAVFFFHSFYPPQDVGMANFSQIRKFFFVVFVLSHDIELLFTDVV